MRKTTNHLLQGWPALLAAGLLLAFLIPMATASALLAPVRNIDGVWFVSERDGAQLVATELRAGPAPDASGLGAGDRFFEIESEMWLRNLRATEQVLEFGATASADAAVHTEVWVNGVPTDTRLEALRRDPALRNYQVEHLEIFSFRFPAEGLVSVRIRTRVQVTTEATGQTRIQIPTHLFGLFGGEVEHGFIEFRPGERPIAVQATLSSHTLFDEPENRLSWFLRSWSPGIPFEIAWMGAWPTLIRVAEVEQCPAPWEVIRRMTAGEASSVAAMIAPLDEATRSFCAALPLVIHGYVFPSESARSQFAQIGMERYLGPAGQRHPLYRENPGFEAGMLSEVERIYRAALLSP